MAARHLSSRQIQLAIIVLIAASAGFTLGFACALPLAAIATIAAMVLPAGAAVAAMLAIWAINQAIGFGCLHYPIDASSFAWGAGLGVIGLAALAASRACLGAGVGVGFTRILTAFAASFVVYEGLVAGGCAISGDCAGSLAAHVVERILLINVGAFGALLTAWSLFARSTLASAPSPRTLASA